MRSSSAPIPDPPEAIREYYRQLYASFRGQPPTADLRLYETAPFPAPGSDANGAGTLEAVDGAIWIALLLRESDLRDDQTKRDVREQIGGKTLSLGVIPIVTDAARRLRPAGAAGAQAETPLRFQLPRIPPGGGLPTRLSDRIPQYRDLEPRTTADVFAEPGIVQLTLPPAGDLVLWNNLDPLESGAADLPPSLDDTSLGDRVITWLRLESSPALPSQLKWIGINTTTVLQRAHVANEVLPDGTGEPDQSCVLSRLPIVAQSVRLRVTANGVTRNWIEIDDLWAAGPEVPVQDPRDPPGTPPRKSGPSEVFAVNLESGEIRFGDGVARRASADRRHPPRRLRLRRRPRRQRRARRDQLERRTSRRRSRDQPGPHVGRRRKPKPLPKARSRSRATCSIAIVSSPPPTSRPSRCARRASTSGASR